MSVVRSQLRRLIIWLLASRATPWLSMIVGGAAAIFAVTLTGADRVAALTLGISVLVALYEPRRRAEALRVFEELLGEAVYEACHNLQHLASYAKAGAKEWPDFHVWTAARLLEPPFAEYTLRIPEIPAVIDHMIRNDDFIRRYELTDANLDAAAERIGYFIEHCMRFVIHAGRAGDAVTGPKVQRVIQAIGVPYLTRIATEESEPFWVRVSRAQAVADVTNARRQRRMHTRANYDLCGTEVCYFWYDDTHEQGPEEALLELFAELSDPPTRPPSR